MQKHLTIPEAAVFLGLTVKVVRNKIERRQLPYRKLGRRILIPSVELAAMMNALPGTRAEEAMAAVMEAER